MERSVDDVIETQDLILRRLRDDDARSIVEHVGDYRVAKNLARVPHPYDMADAVEFLTWQATADARSDFRALCLKHMPDRLIGIISYEFNSATGDAELGYWLAVEHWGRGYMGQAAKAMVHRAFEVSGINRLVSCYFVENPVSGRILRSAGLEEVGPCKAFAKAQGREVPVMKMAVTATKWRKAQAKK